MALIVGVVAACGDDSSADRSAFKAGEETAGGGDNQQEPREPNELTTDAAAPTGDQFRGSPLCHINAGTCDPDDDGTKTINGGTSTKRCEVTPDPDASLVGVPEGCRLSGSAVAPECVEANPANTDGAKCERGADCAAGFDCVTTNDVGYCRRYCCSGSCGTYRSQNGAETFCDVQRLHGWAASLVVKAPVCMPIKTCKLFTVDECAENETCSVVTDDGTTGCVANGNATVGQSCDQEHCSTGLACLGQAGSRKCLQLCKTKNGPTCAANQICKTSPIFPDPTIGFCAPAQ